MEVSKFIEKFNKIEGNSYTFEEEVTLTNGVYVGYLEHDNVVKESIAIYTGQNLTGTKIKNYFLSSPSLAPWRYQIKIYVTDIEKVYVSYETTGDQVEADDINLLQDELLRTQEALNTEEDRAESVENELAVNLNNEIERATNKEFEIDTELLNRYKKEETFTREEVLQKIADLVDSAPGTLDTLHEIANALGNDPNFSTTIINLLGNKVDKEEGKTLTTNDYTNEEKQRVEDSYNCRIPYILVEGENNVLTATLEGITEYTDGFPLCVKLPIDATDICTLNLNSLGAITIQDSGQLKSNIPYNIRYEVTSNSFILQTKGGDGVDTSDATASAEDILINKSAYGPNGKIKGAMPINSGINKVLALNETYSIPKGYQDGTSKVTQNITNNGTLNGSIGVNGTFNIPAGYISGGKVTQSITTQGAYTNPISWANGGDMYVRIPQGAYFTNTSAGYPEIIFPLSWIQQFAGADSSKIVVGQSIAGVTGSASIGSLGGKLYATGNVVCDYQVSITTGFAPTFILAYGTDRSCLFAYDNGLTRYADSSGSTNSNTYTIVFTISSTGFTLRLGGYSSEIPLKYYAFS